MLIISVVNQDFLKAVECFNAMQIYGFYKLFFVLNYERYILNFSKLRGKVLPLLKSIIFKDFRSSLFVKNTVSKEIFVSIIPLSWQNFRPKQRELNIKDLKLEFYQEIHQKLLIK